MNTYTKDEIERAKTLFAVLFPNDTKESLYYTNWGKKSNTGVINTILSIMFDGKEENN